AVTSHPMPPANMPATNAVASPPKVSIVAPVTNPVPPVSAPSPKTQNRKPEKTTEKEEKAGDAEKTMSELLDFYGVERVH
ncbi:MAG: hypothetical protein IKR48_13345, partial [Kiritimatiellae bacterium]|nr:hypothetical protein [Kiritimatiellia bacterium]